MGRITPSLVGLLLALAVAIAVPAHARAQVDLCGNQNVATASGTTICTAPALTATATVRSVVVLTLEEIFGAPATGLNVNFGDVDAHCAGVPATGMSCSAEGAADSAVWYGQVRFSVRMGGARGLLGPVTARLTGARTVGGSIPLNRLLDGTDGSVPATPYRPVVSINLKTGIPNGRTIVNRSIGLRVNATDATGVWSGNLVYNVVME